SENEFPTGVHKGGTYGKLVNVAASGNPARPYGQTASGNARQPDVPSRVGNAVTRLDLSPGDWDTGFGDQKDGPYINKPDEGDTAFNDNQNGEIRPPYLLGFNQGFAAGLGEYFSPNRQIPSPLMLGSIPTGVQRFRPWQTLLFHPRPEDPQHPGRESPPDHLLADLFWMPVVEPYAISQPFATSGKINMNYQIQPFTHIRRDTGLRAVMKSTKFLALPLAASSSYKPLDPGNNRARTPNARKAIDLPTAPGVVPNTLKAFDVQFKAGLFRSATQICEINLMPAGVPVQPPAGLDELNSAMAAFWRNNPLTGDNVREKPYVDIYPRLTTKSNVYNIHMHVQVLKKAANTPPDQWVQNRDQVLSEYRGSSIVERYIDANDSRLPDFASQFAANPSDSSLNIDQYYRMRVVSTKTFTP
ncbi:MAG TPA: Verru_Chthon cassette protein A, partial [Hymenobacter sp.]|nr:Verru_Chthon cassette protein A [Hymenobacter sp.]